MRFSNLREENFNKLQKEFLFENCNYSDYETIFLTFDIDWVPDYMLEMVADLVSGLDVLYAHPFFKSFKKINSEFASGIHPNLKNSDQGDDIDEVINFSNKINLTC